METIDRLKAQVAADSDDSDDRSVGAKMAHAQIIKSVVSKGCIRCLALVE